MDILFKGLACVVVGGLVILYTPFHDKRYPFCAEVTDI